jgi:hypothetical protein
MSRRLLITVAFTLVGAAGGICWAMLYRASGILYVYIGDSLPPALAGAYVGLMVGWTIAEVCRKWSWLRPAVEVLTATLLCGSMAAPLGWIAGDIPHQRDPRSGMLWGAVCGAVVGLGVGLVQLVVGRLRPAGTPTVTEAAPEEAFRGRRSPRQAVSPRSRAGMSDERDKPSDEGIKPGHIPISEVLPDPGREDPHTSFPGPLVPIPDLLSAPEWTGVAAIYAMGLFWIVLAGALLVFWAGDLVSLGMLPGIGLSLILLLTGTIQTASRQSSIGLTDRLFLSGLLLGYCALTVLVYPFFIVPDRDVTRFILPVGWLAPILLCGVWFARRRCWLQAIGAGLFLFVYATGIMVYMIWGERGSR